MIATQAIYPPRFRQAGIARKTVCSPEHIINTSDQTEKTRYRDGDTDDIIETIMWMDANSRRWVRDEVAAECLRGDTPEETLRNVWAFVKHNVKYRADRPGHERVKSPGALYTSGSGDCKSFSIAEAALLRALGIPYKYRFASYDGGDYTHVYVIARMPSGWLPVDAVYGKALAEERYTKKVDVAPRKAINGTSSDKWTPATGSAGINWTGIALVGIVLYLLK